MDYNAYKNPDKSDLIRNLKYAVEVYGDILKLQEPLDVLKKIDQDTAEYKALYTEMQNLPFYKKVKVYFDRYYKDIDGLIDYMDMIGNNIDKGYASEVSPMTNMTYQEEHKVVREAVYLLAHKKGDFKKLYTRLTTTGPAELKQFAIRHQQNLQLRAKTLDKCVDRDPAKQEKKVQRALDNFKAYCGRPSTLYLTAYQLEKHLTRMVNSGTIDEYVETYLTPMEIAQIGTDNKPNIANKTSLYRVEEYIKNIANGTIKLNDIPVKQNTPDEDQP